VRSAASVWSVCAAPSRNAGAGAEPKTGGGKRPRFFLSGRIRTTTNNNEFWRDIPPIDLTGRRCRAVTEHGTVIEGRLEYTLSRVTQFPDEPALEQLSFADVLQPVILNLNGDHVGNRLCTGYVSLEEVG